MGKLIYHISALTDNGTYEFDAPTDNADFADAVTDALASGLAVFRTVSGETVALNGARLLGAVIAPTDAEQDDGNAEQSG